MIEKAKVETRSFNGVRVVVHTSLTYDVVLGKLRSLMGASTVGEVVALAKKPITEAEFTREGRGSFGRRKRLHAVRRDRSRGLASQIRHRAANHALDNWQSALCHHDDPP